MDDIIDINTLFGPLPAASSDLSVDTLLQLMQKHKVGAACTLSTLGLLLDPTVGNAATRAACVEHPELMPIATLNPTLYFGDPEPVLRLKTDNFCLVRFFPGDQGWPVDFAPFRALLRCLDETALPVMVNVSHPGEITQLATVLDGYPAPIILSGVDASLLAEAVAVLRRHADWHIETSRLVAPGCIKQVADTVGAQRLLFGSRAPVQPIASLLMVLKQSGVPEASHQQILSGNARRILNKKA